MSTGHIETPPIPLGECDTNNCANFIFQTAAVKPTAEQRDELECTLRNACLPEYGCQISTYAIVPVLERIVINA